jgi:L-fuculose-phosphate aldolase
MRQVISARDIEQILKRGEALSLPEGALLTPSARDLLAQYELRKGVRPEPPARPRGGTPKGPCVFDCPDVVRYKEEICEIGRRLWQRAYVDGNGGNISLRVADDLVLCTPTLVSKGFMKPDDLAFVDLDGNQKHGKLRRTSEILMHLEIMKAQPKARACVHAHPPYATGFAVAGVQPPNSMIPELEVFVGEIAIAPYETPGSKAMGQEVAALADTHNTILMANHGVVAWGKSVEDAYFKIEIIEAYCRTVLVAAQLGKPPNTFTPSQLKDLLKIKEGLGIPDRRIGLKEADLSDAQEWRPGVTCTAIAPAANENALDGEAEALVEQITETIMTRIGT